MGWLGAAGAAGRMVGPACLSPRARDGRATRHGYSQPGDDAPRSRRTRHTTRLLTAWRRRPALATDAPHDTVTRSLATTPQSRRVLLRAAPPRRMVRHRRRHDDAASSLPNDDAPRCARTCRDAPRWVPSSRCTRCARPARARSSAARRSSSRGALHAMTFIGQLNQTYEVGASCQSL